ncbi:MAG: SAM-dependent methyltransferase [Burkholderiales bacterium]
MLQRILRSRPRALGRAIGCAAALALTQAFAADVSVPYVPTPQGVVERMLEIARVGPQDYLIDLGSGDGRIVVTAAKKYGTRGFGVDLNPTRIDEANENARKAGVTDKVQFHQRDLFETDLSAATVVTMYLLPRVNLELRPKLLDLKPGTRLVSHDFSMGDWKPDTHEEVEAKDKYGGSGGRSDVYLWIVPAKVAGTWRAQMELRGKPVNYELTFEQEYQALSGTARVAGRPVRFQSAVLRGDQLTVRFTADVGGVPTRHEFAARVDGGVMSGTADLSGPKLQAKLDWSAKRVSQSASTAARIMH